MNHSFSRTYAFLAILMGCATVVAFPSPATAQDVHTGNATVKGGLCVGSGCADNQYYNANTMMLRTATPRIQIDDLSPTSAFGQTDWAFVFNGDDSAPLNYFAVENEDTGVTPFVIDAGAGPSSLVVAANSHVGLGTSLPQSDLHILSNFVPEIRFEQDYSGTSLDAIWEVSVSHNGFFVRDTNNAISALSIRPNSRSHALAIATGGDIGFGTNAPLSALHLQRSDNTAALLIEDTGAGTLGQLILRNNGITFFTLEDTSLPDIDYSGRKWNFQNQNGTFRVTTPPGGPGEIEMLLEPVNGDMTIRGQLYTGGSCAAGCDRVLDADYPLPSIPEQMAAIRANGHLPNVGPTDEEGPFNLSAMSTGMLNELEKAHLYIGVLHDENEKLRSVVADQAARLTRVEAMLDTLAGQSR